MTVDVRFSLFGYRVGGLLVTVDFPADSGSSPAGVSVPASGAVKWVSRLWVKGMTA